MPDTLPLTVRPSSPMTEAEIAAFYAPKLDAALAAFPLPWADDGLDWVTAATREVLLMSSATADISGHTPALLRLSATAPAAITALRRLLAHYLRVASADGTWDPEADPEVIAARAVLARVGVTAS